MRRKRNILKYLGSLLLVVFVVSNCGKKPTQYESTPTPVTIQVYKENGVYKSNLNFPVDKWPQVVIVDSTNFWRPGVPIPPDTTDPEPPIPPVVDFDYEVDTEAELADAAQKAKTGEVVALRAGTYRQTITPANSGVTFQAYPGEKPVISGLNLITTPWVVHSGNIYKTTITLPVNGFNTSTARINENQLNLTIFANQIFKDGEMMFEARWPNISTFSDMLSREKYKNGVNYTNGFNMTDLTDAALSGITNMVGGTLVCNGWFAQETRTITSHSGNTLRWSSPIWNDTYTGKWVRKRYYLTGRLGLLDAPKEFHYENGTLFFWSPTNGPPTGKLEYKARNWAFDIRGKSNISLKGLYFIGCEPAHGDAAAPGAVLDGIRASYINHHVRHDVVEWQGVGMSKQFGIKLLGANSVIKNSEVSFSGSTGVWLGPSGIAENNYFHDMGYVGYWANPVTLWATDGYQKIIHNSFERTGRSGADWGYNYGVAPGTSKHYNVEIAYNWFTKWGLISQDVGATYGWGQVDLSNFNYHHNWIGVTGAADAPDVGLNTGIYFDQSSGPGTVHHNVVYLAGAADTYHEVTNEERPHKGVWTQPNPAIKYYNNTFANIGSPITNNPSQPYPRSYITYEPAPYDIQRNNIYLSTIVADYGRDIANCIMPGTDPKFLGGDQERLRGLYYQLQPNSPAVNTGIAIAGITDNAVGLPDMGAYEYGAAPWIPGHDWSKTEDPNHYESGDSREVRTGTWNYYANTPWMTPGMFSNQDYEYTSTMGATLTINFKGTGIMWYSERRENHGIVEIEVDNGAAQRVDLYYNSQVNGTWKAFEKTGLSNGDHKIEITLVGKNDATVGAPGFLHDYFKIIPASSQQSAPVNWLTITIFILLLVFLVAFIVYLNKKKKFNHGNKID